MQTPERRPVISEPARPARQRAVSIPRMNPGGSPGTRNRLSPQRNTNQTRGRSPGRSRNPGSPSGGARRSRRQSK